jgi:propionate CoA-transferase
VSKFGPRLAGAGGFINISQNAKKVVFVGTFMAGRLQLTIEDGHLRIINDGKVKKFIREVEHRTFSGDYAAKRGQPVLYVTERCVFDLTQGGLELIEVAPGIDIERDILARMEFRPIIRRDPAVMDRRIFANKPMGLRDDLLRMPLEQRFTSHNRTNSS